MKGFLWTCICMWKVKSNLESRTETTKETGYDCVSGEIGFYIVAELVESYLVGSIVYTLI